MKIDFTLIHRRPDAGTLKELGFRDGRNSDHLVEVSSDRLYAADISPSSEVAKTAAAVVRVVAGSKKKGLGSGTIVRDDGIILTAEHVVKSKKTVMVKVPIFPYPDDPSGCNSHKVEMFTKHEGRVIGRNKKTDTAILKVDDLPSDIEPLKIASEDLGIWVQSLGYIVMKTQEFDEASFVQTSTIANRDLLLLTTGERLKPETDIQDVQKKSLRRNIIIEAIKRLVKGGETEGASRSNVLMAVSSLLAPYRFSRRVRIDSGKTQSSFNYLDSGMSGGPTLNISREVIGVNSSVGWTDKEVEFREALNMLGIKQPEDHPVKTSNFTSLNDIHGALEQAGIGLETVIA